MQRFTQISNKFIKEQLQELSELQLKVYLCLAMFADNGHRHAYPSRKTMQEITGYSKRSISRAFSELESLGLIERIRRHGHSTICKLINE